MCQSESRFLTLNGTSGQAVSIQNYTLRYLHFLDRMEITQRIQSHESTITSNGEDENDIMIIMIMIIMIIITIDNTMNIISISDHLRLK
ncbi:hypothetical protein PHET_05301 [Paragonimus heterotremus]|uniref:Uncharacterized protein n=1 Tax=Paragonimus heterotremus TaxID=100268 RepID=A0A8J4X059_9TREM|nr:hypothetical protein PHET_05301 [Paragonimus heterotremus]